MSIYFNTFIAFGGSPHDLLYGPDEPRLDDSSIRKSLKIAYGTFFPVSRSGYTPAGQFILFFSLFLKIVRRVRKPLLPGIRPVPSSISVLIKRVTGADASENIFFLRVSYTIRRACVCVCHEEKIIIFLFFLLFSVFFFSIYRRPSSDSCRIFCWTFLVPRNFYPERTQSNSVVAYTMRCGFDASTTTGNNELMNFPGESFGFVSGFQFFAKLNNAREIISSIAIHMFIYCIYIYICRLPICYPRVSLVDSVECAVRSFLAERANNVLSGTDLKLL